MDASPVVVKPDILPGFEKFTWPEIPRGPGGIPSTFHLCADLPGWFPVGISRDAGDLPSLPVSPICDTVLVGRSVCRCSCMLAWAGFTWIPESCSTLAPGPGGPFSHRTNSVGAGLFRSRLLVSSQNIPRFRPGNLAFRYIIHSFWSGLALRSWIWGRRGGFIP